MEVDDGGLEVAEGEALVGAASDAALDRLHDGQVFLSTGLVDEVRVTLPRRFRHPHRGS